MSIKKENLKRMFQPRHIVFIGTYHIVKQGILNCKKLDYDGEIFAVHLTRDEIAGIRCMKTIQDLPMTPDVAYIAVQGKRSIQVIKELQALGTFGCVCYAAGFSEIGEESLQEDLVEAAGNMALIGPNCYGMINFLDGVPLWPDRHGGKMINQGVAIISQSGNMSLNLTMTDRSLPLAYTISIGNQAVLDVADYIDVLCDDPRVNAIGLHIEGLDDINSFIKSAKKAAAKEIPIVAFKTGISEIGSQLTMSHTSSLAGADELYNVLFSRLNICRANSLAVFLETLKLFSITPSYTGRRLGVLTCSGGESTVVADLATEHQFEFAALTTEQEETIGLQLTAFEHISNPLDYNTSIWGDEYELEKCFLSFMKGNFDVTILVLDLLEMETGNVQPWQASIHAFIQAHQQFKSPAIAISILPEGIPLYYRDQLIKCGITPLQGVNEAFQAMDKVVMFHARKHHISSHVDEHITRQLLVNEITYEEEEAEADIINEWEGKQILHYYGISVPNGRLISSVDEGANITEGIQGPYVVKKVSSHIAHKTELGAVFLNLQSEQDVKDAIEQMSTNVAFLHDYEQNYLLEEMIQEVVVELNIGIKKDEQFGLVLVISMGGELVNLLNDSVSILLPATTEEIVEGLYSLQGMALLQGYRGRPKGDVNGVILAAEAVARFSEHYQHNLLEMDVNPLLVLPEGEGVIAADVFIRTCKSINMLDFHGQQKLL